MSVTNRRYEGLDPDPSMCSGIVLTPCEGEMRVPDIALSCVVYIGEATAKGTFKARGTGFIGVVERPEEPARLYLITADHVRRGLLNDRNFAIRINDRQGKAQILRSPTAFQWWPHLTDKSVDAAVFPWMHPEFPIAAFPSSRFVTEENLRFNKLSDPGIGIGDEVYIIGLFRKMAGRNKITPIVRHGHIAMMATEHISTRGYSNSYLHLVEAFSTAGLSGSPVFVNETVYFPYQGSRPRAYADESGPMYTSVAMAVGPTHILGLIHGMMPVETMVELAGDVSDPKQKWNSGISLVVPSTKILEIINQPELIEYEHRWDEALKDSEPVETALGNHSKGEKPKRKNRDVKIPPVSRKTFFEDLEKATKKKP
jgi:hypothetical protein